MGPLSFDLDGIDVRHVAVDGHEVVSRIYVGVRDTDWNTLPGRVTQLDVRTTRGDSIETGFEARHEGAGIAYRWRGSIRATAQGTLVYVMDGQADADFRHNRIGFCVLHPASVAGRPFRAVGPQGVTDGVLSELIAPQTIVDGLEVPLLPACSSLAVELEPVTVTTAFEGDLFETEDQRNWTDASFKTYCTPIALGYPHVVRRGQAFWQRVTLMTERSVASRPRRPIRRRGPLEVEIARGSSSSWPELGLGSAISSPGGLGPADRHRLRALALDHVRIDLRLSEPDWGSRLDRAIADAAALDCRLEVALFVSETSAGELSEAAERLAGARVARVIGLYEPTAGRAVTPRLWLERIAAAVESGTGLHPPLLTGTDGDFAELNRDRPTAGGAGVAYALNPQVHSFDETSLVETLPTQALTVATARSFGRGLVTVTPITLRQRFNPAAAEPAAPGAVQPLVDPRQPSLFAAGWTLGSIASLVEGCVDAVTYFETAGPRGVIGSSGAGQGAGPIPAAAVYPVWFVLADLADRAGWLPASVMPGTGPIVTGLAMRRPTRLRLLVANVRPEPVRIAIAPIEARWARVRILDADTSLAAQAAPSRFLRSGDRHAVMAGRLELDLAPFAYARIDARLTRA